MNALKSKIDLMVRIMSQGTLILLLAACSSSTGSEKESGQGQTEATTAKIEEVDAVCIWDNISVRAVPSSDGTWVTSLSVGESLVYLNVDSLDQKGQKRTYARIRLADGTEGWSLKDFIIPEGKVAVFLDATPIYKRPDLLTKTDDSFSQLDIVAIKSTQDDWMEVVGKRKEADWISNGWVRGNNVSQNALDVAVAKFGGLALKEEQEEKRLEKLQEIISNPDFKDSKFIPILQAVVSEIEKMETSQEETEEVEVLNDADSIQ